jgi:hypothetical protein
MQNEKRTDVSPLVSRTTKSGEQRTDSIIIDAEDFNNICLASAINFGLLARTILNRPENENSIRGIVVCQ